jgi:hypothetical protein
LYGRGSRRCGPPKDPVIRPSGRQHEISSAEIGTVVNYPEFRIGVRPRLDVEAELVLFIVGRAADNGPHIEVIADVIAPAVMVAFHAVMLRPTVVKAHRLDLHITPEYGPQKA